MSMGNISLSEPTVMEKTVTGVRPLSQDVSDDTIEQQHVENAEQAWRIDWRLGMVFVTMMIQYNASYFGFVSTASSVSYINADLGPKPYYFWIPTIWNLTFCATIPVFGRMEDIFGRRYLMIFGNAVSVVGAIIGGNAHSIGIVILAVGFLGIGAAIQQTANACVSELVPRKYRPHATGIIGGSGIVGGSFGTPIGIHVASKLSWRWCFWITLMFAGVGIIGLVLFYFPPTFDEVHQADARSKLDELKKIDVVGIILFAGSTTTLLIGISWGGTTYPWKSAQTIVPIIIGAIGLIALSFWEVYACLSEPIFPAKLFKNVRGFTMVLVTEFVCGMLLISLTSLWPVQVGVVYFSDPNKAVWRSCTVLLACFVGVIILGNTLDRIGHARWIIAGSAILNTILIGCMAAMTVNTPASAVAISLLNGFTLGFIQLVGIAMILLNCPDKDLGVAIGLKGTARTLGGSIATALYSTILANRVKDDLPRLIAEATLPLGLPVTSLKPLIIAMTSGHTASAMQIPGVTAAILSAAGMAFKQAYVEGFRLVYLVAIAFGVVGSTCACFTKDIDHLLTNKVAATLRHSSMPKSAIHNTDNVDTAKGTFGADLPSCTGMLTNT